MGSRIVVIGGTGLVGRHLVDELQRRAQAVVVASPTNGVDAFSGHGLREAIEYADVVVDVSNPRRTAPRDALEYFRTTTTRLLEIERDAGVGHHVALSVVGVDSAEDDSYFAAKRAQERLIQESDVPHTILRSTQFFEFARDLSSWNTEDDTVHLPPTDVQPVATGDVAAELRRLVLRGEPEGIVEMGGPELMPLPDFVRRVLLYDHDDRYVVSDTRAHANGFNLGSHHLVPDHPVTIGTTRLEVWLNGGSPARAR